MHRHRVRVAEEKWVAGQETVKGGGNARQRGVRGLSLRRIEHPHLRVAVQDIDRMRRFSHLRRQVLARGMALHVHAAAPHPASRDVDDPSAVRDVRRTSVFPVEAFQFLEAELLFVCRHVAHLS